MATSDLAVRLRPIGDDDTDLVVCWRNSEAVRLNFIYRATLTVADHRRWLSEQVAPGHVAQFIIEVGDERKPVGSTFIRDIDPVNRRGEFGIFIGDDATRGRGVGTEAARQIVAHGFTELGLNRIYLRVLAHNAGAVHSYEKVGFVREGCLRKDVILDGVPTDVILMAIVREEWER